MNNTQHSILTQLIKLEEQLIVPGTENYAFKSYAGSVTGIVNGKSVTINVTGNCKMQYCVEGKPRHFNKVLELLAA